jgi:hypothetical protein
MLNTYVKNRGETKSIIHSNNHNKVSQVKWDADYDGHDGNISLDILDNNKKKHIDLKFDHHDLEQIFNVPTENTSLDKRLLRDFSMTHAHNKKKINAVLRGKIESYPYLDLEAKKETYNEIKELNSQLINPSRQVIAYEIEHKELEYRLTQLYEPLTLIKIS